MEPYLLRQHKILTEKLGSAEESWRQLRHQPLAFEPNNELDGFQPRQTVSVAGSWYLLAKKNELAYRSALRISIAYPVALLIIASICFGTMVTKVLPIFKELYSSSLMPLPQLTQLVLDYFLVIGLGTTAVLLLFVVATVLVNRAIKTSQMIPRVFYKLAIFSPWIENYNNNIHGRKLLAWHQTGIQLTAPDVDGFISAEELKLAQDNNTLKETLRDLTPELSEATLASINQQINIMATALLGPVIGLFLVAMYLPIFQMGSIN